MKSSNARDKLVAAAETLMLSKGYPATTVDSMCAEAGVSKGSFYHFFKSKEELGLAVLDVYFTERVQPLADGPHTAAEDPVERAFVFLDHAEGIAAELWTEGCLLGTFATDISATSPRIRARVSALFDKFARGLAVVFDGVAAAGRPGAPSSVELAEHFLAVVEGSIILAKAHDDWGKFGMGIQNFRRYLRLLVD